MRIKDIPHLFFLRYSATFNNFKIFCKNHLRQTANMNLHHMTNFSLYLLFTVYYYLTQKLAVSCHFYTLELF